MHVHVGTDPYISLTRMASSVHRRLVAVALEATSLFHSSHVLELAVEAHISPALRNTHIAGYTATRTRTGKHRIARYPAHIGTEIPLGAGHPARGCLIVRGVQVCNTQCIHACDTCVHVSMYVDVSECLHMNSCLMVCMYICVCVCSHFGPTGLARVAHFQVVCLPRAWEAFHWPCARQTHV